MVEQGNSTATVKAVIGAASTLVAEGVSHVLAGLPVVRVVATAWDASAAVAALQSHRPDLLILDIELARAVHAEHPGFERDARVLIVGVRAHLGTALTTLVPGTCGYVGGRSSSLDMHETYEYVARCGFRRACTDTCSLCPVRETQRLPKLPLSERESEVFARVGHGQGATRIATDLHVSVKTIETYRESIKRKLHLASAAELLEVAIGWRLGDAVQAVVRNRADEGTPPVEHRERERGRVARG